MAQGEELVSNVLRVTWHKQPQCRDLSPALGRLIPILKGLALCPVEWYIGA